MMPTAKTPPTGSRTACDLLDGIATRAAELRALVDAAGDDLPPRLLAHVVSDLADTLAAIEATADDLAMAGPTPAE